MDGLYDDCTIVVTDTASNSSSALALSDFTVSLGTTPPVVVDEFDFGKAKVSYLDKAFNLVKNLRSKVVGRNIIISGTDPDMAGGEVSIKVNDKRIGTASVASDGKWRKKIAFKKTSKVRLTLTYSKDNFSETKTFRLKVDAEDPVFDTIPATLNKRPGARVFWNAIDNDKVKRYEYTFQSKKRKTTSPVFNLPTDIAPGIYPLTIKAFDKAGNKTKVSVVIRIR